MIPLGDAPNPRNFTPWVNYLLIGVNVAIYLFITLPLSGTSVDPRDPLLHEYLRHLAPVLRSFRSLREVLSQISQYDLFVFTYGYKPAAPEGIDLLVSMFLHANFLHLAGNMLFLWIYGDNVEHRLGRLLYLVVYLVTGIAATLFFSVFSSDSMIPLVGASGAISGVLGLYFLLFPRNRVRMLVWMWPFFADVVTLPARWVLGFYLLIDNLLPFLVGASSHVAYGAHIGGFLAGLGIAVLGERVGWQWPWRESIATFQSVADRFSSAFSSSPMTLGEAIREGDSATALRLFAEADEEEWDALTPAECVQLSLWLESMGYPSHAVRLLRRYLHQRRSSPEAAEIFLQLGLLRLRQGQFTTAYQHLLDAIDVAPDSEAAQRAREVLDSVFPDLRRRR